MNSALLVYKELQIRDSFSVLDDYFGHELAAIPEQIRQLYANRRDTLEKLAAAEPLCGDNPKLLKLYNLLDDLFSGDDDPQGTIVLCCSCLSCCDKRLTGLLRNFRYEIHVLFLVN